MFARELDLSADVIDVRDIIARVEELRTERLEYSEGTDVPDESLPEDETGIRWNTANPVEAEELALLESILSDLAGCGGDEKWEGTWYPVTLVHDRYFREYAQELAEDTGATNDNAAWPYTCIDWDKAAWELRMDYTSVDLDGETYWYR